MNNEKILTIIVPAYNMEHYLDKCLSSLIIDDAAMEKLQVIIVNDGSKDHTSDIAHCYQDNYPDVFQVVDKQNGNYGSCINFGLSIAVGKYVKILDADDSYNTACLSEYLNFLESSESDLILSDVNSITNGHEVCSHFSLCSDKEYRLSDLSPSDISCVFIHHTAYRRSVLAHHHQTEGISYTDIEWTVIPTRYVNSVSYFPRPLYNYILSREGQTVNPSVHAKNMHMERDVIMHVISDYLSYNDFSDNVQNSFAKDKILALTEQLYQYYLLTLNKFTDINELIAFDGFIRDSSLDLYEITGKFSIKKSFYTFPYVKSFRRKKSRKGLSFFIYDLYRDYTGRR